MIERPTSGAVAPARCGGRTTRARLLPVIRPDGHVRRHKINAPPVKGGWRHGASLLGQFRRPTVTSWIRAGRQRGLV